MQKSKRQLKNSKLTNIFLSFYILTIIASCNSGDKKKTEKSTFSSDKNVVVEDYNTLYSVQFPDTVIVGKKNKGLIKYSSPLDTIKLSNNDRRYTWLYVKGHKDTLSLKELFKIEHDTFAMISDGKIPLYDFVFNKTGENYIDGYIEDQVVIDNFDKEKSRIITETSRIKKKVFVLDSLSVIRLKKKSLKTL